MIIKAYVASSFGIASLGLLLIANILLGIYYLEPAELGLLAVIGGAFSLTIVLAEFGALTLGVNFDLKDKVHLVAYFYINLFLSVILTLIVFIIYHYIDDGGISNNLFWFLCLTLVLTSIGFAGRVGLKRELKFWYISFIEFLTVIITLTIASWLIFKNQYFTAAIIITFFPMALRGVLFFFIFLKKYFLFNISFKNITYVLKEGYFVVLEKTVAQFSNSFPIFIVSSLIGLEASGYISLLTQILMLATGVIAVVNAKVLQPLLKNYDRTSKSLAHDNYVKIISIAFFAIGTYVALIVLFTNDIGLYFPRWAELTLLVLPFSLLTLFRSVGSEATYLLMIQGNFRELFQWRIFWVIYENIGLLLLAIYIINLSDFIFYWAILTLGGAILWNYFVYYITSFNLLRMKFVIIEIFAVLLLSVLLNHFVSDMIYKFIIFLLLVTPIFYFSFKENIISLLKNFKL